MTKRAALRILFAKLRLLSSFASLNLRSWAPVTCMSRPKRMPSAP